MRKVVVTGPECSGKSVLSQALAAHYGVPWVPEMARPFLEGLGRPYEEADLLAIARLQLRTEEERGAEAARTIPPLLICDTDLITIRIWGEVKYGRSDPWIMQQTEQRPYDLWLLSTPDLPWVPDPLREHPNERDRLFDMYRHTLKALGKPFVIISGREEERLRQALAAIDGAGWAG